MSKKFLSGMLITAGLVYTAAAGCLAVRDWLVMFRQNSKCRYIEMGQKRLADGDVTRLPLYSDEEKNEAPALKDAELYCFPSLIGEKRPYILFLPGGGYLKCAEDVVMPVAAEVNRLGYTAFILRYRVGRFTSRYAPVDDTAAAVRYITEHASQLNVEAENYMIVGLSAGADLAGLFASDSLGYRKYGLPKPAALTLLYPWSNFTAPLSPTGNLFKDAYNYIGKSLAAFVMLGSHSTAEEKEELCVHRHIEYDYTPCFIVQGDRDFLAPSERHADILVKELKEKSVPFKYKICKGLTHGFGYGYGTSAHGWVKESVEFWKDFSPVIKA